MTQEEINNLSELKYKEIEELESQKEGLVDYHLKDIGEQMVKHKYYISEKWNYQTKSLLVVKSFTIEKGKLVIHALNDSFFDTNNNYIDDFDYEYCTFISISKEIYDDLLSKLTDYLKIRESLIAKFNQFKNKS